MDLLKGIKVEEHTCRVCGRPCGLFDECDRCFLDRLESQFDELMDESAKPSLPDGLMDEVEWTESSQAEAGASTPPPPLAPESEAEPKPEIEPEAEIEPEPDPEQKSTPPPSVPVVDAPVPVAAATSAPPEERRTRWRILIPAALGVVAIAVAYVVLRDDSDGVSTAAPEQPPAATSAPPAAPVIGDWRGQIEVRYENGIEDELIQILAIDALNEGEVAGFSRSRQNGGSCRGPLTFTGMQGQAFAFDYRERNTAECIATGQVTLTPRGDATLDYREVTKSSVNRGTLTRE